MKKLSYKEKIDMLVEKLRQEINIAKLKGWSDEEIIEDMESLMKELKDSDEYKAHCN